jgi:hypothetical protein
LDAVKGNLDEVIAASVVGVRFARVLMPITACEVDDWNMPPVGYRTDAP